MPIFMNFQNGAPLDVVDFYFNQISVEQGKPCQDVIRSIENQFEADYLRSDDAYFEIPSMNTFSISRIKPSQSLARFCCMIQDMREPEMIPGRIRVRRKSKNDPIVKNALFRDTVGDEYEYDDCSDEFEDIVTRHLFNCVMVPAETDWLISKRLKAEENRNLIEVPDNESNSNGSKRRRRSEMERSMEMVDSDDPHSTKRVDLSKIEEKTVKRSAATMKECLVKVFCDAESYKLNDIVEFVGILCSSNSDENCTSDVTYSLHAIYARKISSLHPDLCRFSLAAEDKYPKLESYLPNLHGIRSKLIDFLANGLLGDRLAAEYLLCHLLSSSIHKDVSCVGKFTLNLFNILPDSPSSSFIFDLKEKLARILTKLHYLPMKLETLNGENFVPKKDYEKNLLRSGRLQFSRGTEIIVDETKLTVGQLNEQGVKNISALKSVISNQKLDYDFVYYGVEFRTDLNVLVLSEGQSCLPADCCLPLLPTDSSTSHVGKTADNDVIVEKDLDDFRLYLILARSTDLNINDQMQEKIREDFVQMRQANSEITQHKLHDLLVLSRWLSCSFGTRSLTETIWERAKTMDEERTKRLAHL